MSKNNSNKNRQIRPKGPIRLNRQSTTNAANGNDNTSNANSVNTENIKIPVSAENIAETTSTEKTVSTENNVKTNNNVKTDKVVDIVNSSNDKKNASGSQPPKKKRKFDFNSILLGACISMVGLGSCFLYYGAEEEKKAEVEEIAKEKALKQSYLKEVSFDSLKFSNEAVLFVPKGVDYREVEQKIKSISTKYNINVSKVVLNDETEKFSEEQDSLISTTYSEVLALSKKIVYKGTDTYDETLGVKTTEVYDKFEAGADVKTAVKEIAELSGASEEEVNKYIKGLKVLEKLVITQPLSKDGGAVLVMFGENMEESRVYIDGSENSLLEWHLVNNGFLNLNKEDQVGNAIKEVKSGGSYIVSIGSNACMFCENTIPAVEEISMEKGVKHLYIDSNTFKNKEGLDQFTKFYLTGPIESNPTVLFIHDGKEISRFTGSQSYPIIEKFVRDSMGLVSKKKETTDKTDEGEKGTSEPAPADKKEETVKELKDSSDKKEEAGKTSEESKSEEPTERDAASSPKSE